jgi:c-di-AMP phosphodiesterase-like protein|tara:strand:+ start:264 stop:464 length:201 start_codon:yes stop_codon:yes gene_type:complete
MFKHLVIIVHHRNSILDSVPAVIVAAAFALSKSRVRIIVFERILSEKDVSRCLDLLQNVFRLVIAR